METIDVRVKEMFSGLVDEYLFMDETEEEKFGKGLRMFVKRMDLIDEMSEWT